MTLPLFFPLYSCSQLIRCIFLPIEFDIYKLKSAEIEARKSGLELMKISKSSRLLCKQFLKRFYPLLFLSCVVIDQLERKAEKFSCIRVLDEELESDVRVDNHEAL